MDTVDLRSDFIARPGEAMLEAFARAARGPLEFGLREDPHQRQLEERMAALLGCEDALVFPTCTMANTVAVLLASQPGDRLLVQPQAHMLLSEAGAAAALAGVVPEAVAPHGSGPVEAILPPADAWREALRAPVDAQRSRVALCALENTHNRGGGFPLPAAATRAITDLAHEAGARAHLDGARLFAAATALGVPLSALAAGFDTTSVSLNKALGAPVAAVLGASRTAIARALPLRQRLGGGIRPVGPACAATLAGLDDLSHLAQVQALARRLASGLQAAGLQVASPEHITSMVLVRVPAPLDAHALVSRCADRGVLALAMDARLVRFALYRGVTAAGVDRAIDAATAAVRAG